MLRESGRLVGGCRCRAFRLERGWCAFGEKIVNVVGVGVVFMGEPGERRADTRPLNGAMRIEKQAAVSPAPKGNLCQVVADVLNVGKFKVTIAAAASGESIIATPSDGSKAPITRISTVLSPVMFVTLIISPGR